jgi:putative SOS response-associated peptidase YedK
MPVFMARNRWDEWLDLGNRETSFLQSLMVSQDPTAGLVTRPVSPRVNVVANNGPEIIEPYELGEPETLF